MHPPVRRTRPKRLRRRGQLALTALILLCFALGIVISLFYAEMIITGYQISRLEKNLANLELETRGLSEEMSKLSSLERVEAVATTRLGMVKPDERQVVLVQAGPEPAISSSSEKTGSPSPGAEAPDSQCKPPGHKTPHWVLQALAELVTRRGQSHPG